MAAQEMISIEKHKSELKSKRHFFFYPTLPKEFGDLLQFLSLSRVKEAGFPIL